MEGRWEAIREWQELMENAAERFGRRINMGRHQKALMEGAGLVEVQETVSKICLWEQADWKGQPFVSAPSEHWLQNGSGQLEKYSFRLFTKTLGWSREETDSFLDRVWQELNQGGLQLYYSYYLVLGKKTGRGVHQRPSA
ncbi:hypothetical protein BDW74DRAFT_146828 [Aspergillus multicolor]|uniref:uncharacterized protein n=1 Tax=Aspergillus multicolor TaxID=41759 RepID=UPI003CCD87A4